MPSEFLLSYISVSNAIIIVLLTTHFFKGKSKKGLPSLETRLFIPNRQPPHRFRRLFPTPF
jgi:hypothetical protein